MADENNIETPGGEEPTSLRDDIASAFDQAETLEAPPADAKGTPPPPGAAPEAQPGERQRGPDGRFAPASADAPGKPAAKPAAAPKPGEVPGQPSAAQKPPAAPQAAPAAAPAAPAAQLRPPASWKPVAREHWAKLPSEVQQEVARREVEVTRTMAESAKAREALGHVQSTLAPFAANIHASGQDAISAIGTFFQADNTLRHGSIAEKANLVASLIKNYGVDVVALDAVLAGQPAQADPQTMMAEQLRREMQAQLQPVLGYFNQLQGKRQSAIAHINQEAGSEVESFGQDAAHEFFDDVRTEMADIVDLYTQRGQPITLQEAYERAIKLNPQVSEILAKRAEQERASAAAQAAQRARRTAASISGSGAPAGAVPGLAGDDRRAMIEAAWNDQGAS